MSDCELIRLTFPAQPVAAFTALGFVLVGGWILFRRRSIGPFVFGLTLIGVGATSFWLHGWAGAHAGAVESVAVVATVSWLAIWVSWRPDAKVVGMWLVAVATVGLVIMVAPTARHGLTGMVIAAFALAVLRNPGLRSDRRLHAALGIFAVALVVYAMSRTGGPWCTPKSVIQGHGLWHLLSASALWLIGEAAGDSEKGTLSCP